MSVAHCLAQRFSRDVFHAVRCRVRGETMKIKRFCVVTSVLVLAGCSDGAAGSGVDGTGGATAPFGGASATGGSVALTGTSGRAGTGGRASGGTTASNGGRGNGNGGVAPSTGGQSSGGAIGSGGNGSGGAGGGAPGTPGTISGCSVFTANDAWNKSVAQATIDQTWTTRIQTVISAGLKLHPDYGNSGSEHYGIPINVVPATQAAVKVTFDDYPDESDPGPYPFPDPGSAHIEGGTAASCDGDCHFIVVQGGACMLYEGYACHYAGGWHCANGAKWDLTKPSYGQRPKGWTSADAAGLAIMPGLVRLDEVRSGTIPHAIRFTMGCSRPNYVAPATHQAVPNNCDASNPNSPPMGLRLRLNPSKFDISKLSASAQVVARAMQTYGLILADNGSDFYFQGEDNPGWTEQDVEPLKTIPASAFEAITPPALEQ
jgi:hypothetical protein